MVCKICKKQEYIVYRIDHDSSTHWSTDGICEKCKKVMEKMDDDLWKERKEERRL